MMKSLMGSQVKVEGLVHGEGLGGYAYGVWPVVAFNIHLFLFLPILKSTEGRLKKGVGTKSWI